MARQSLSGRTLPDKNQVRQVTVSARNAVGLLDNSGRTTVLYTPQSQAAVNCDAVRQFRPTSR